jgi:hypothetical protein
MILLVHLLFGALIGQKISNPFLAVILAYFSHYFLDVFPHVEYSIENITNKQWRKARPDILMVILDFLLGIFLILLFSNPPAGGQPIIYICAFFAILPDGFAVLSHFFSNKIFEAHNNFHKKIHFYKHKKISNFWRIASQAAIIIIVIVLLRF